MIPFGKLGCVNGRKVAKYAPHMQREGILLMLETGLSLLDVARETGIGAEQAKIIADNKTSKLSPNWSF